MFEAQIFKLHRIQGKLFIPFEDIGKDKEMMDCLNTGKLVFDVCIFSHILHGKSPLASHVLQFVLLGNTGFRFPFAHWPTKEVDPSALYILFWIAVFWLLKGLSLVISLFLNVLLN